MNNTDDDAPRLGSAMLARNGALPTAPTWSKAVRGARQTLVWFGALNVFWTIRAYMRTSDAISEARKLGADLTDDPALASRLTQATSEMHRALIMGLIVACIAIAASWLAGRHAVRYLAVGLIAFAVTMIPAVASGHVRGLGWLAYGLLFGSLTFGLYAAWRERGAMPVAVVVSRPG